MSLAVPVELTAEPTSADFNGADRYTSFSRHHELTTLEEDIEYLEKKLEGKPSKQKGRGLADTGVPNNILFRAWQSVEEGPKGNKALSSLKKIARSWRLKYHLVDERTAAAMLGAYLRAKKSWEAVDILTEPLKFGYFLPREEDGLILAQALESRAHISDKAIRASLKMLKYRAEARQASPCDAAEVDALLRVIHGNRDKAAVFASALVSPPKAQSEEGDEPTAGENSEEAEAKETSGDSTALDRIVGQAIYAVPADALSEDSLLVIADAQLRLRDGSHLKAVTDVLSRVQLETQQHQEANELYKAAALLLQGQVEEGLHMLGRNNGATLTGTYVQTLVDALNVDTEESEESEASPAASTNMEALRKTLSSFPALVDGGSAVDLLPAMEEPEATETPDAEDGEGNKKE
eukprot:Clim_evm41s243 gene=Clim_evmTU41s243